MAQKHNTTLQRTPAIKPAVSAELSVKVLGLSSQTLDALFRRYRQRAGLSGFTFHDARHTAATMLARRLDVLTLCKMFGWKSTSQALTYYNPTPAQIKRMLERPRAA